MTLEQAYMFQHTRSSEQSFWHYMTEDLNQRLKERLCSVCVCMYVYVFFFFNLKLATPNYFFKVISIF